MRDPSKNKGGRPPYQPTEKDRQYVKTMSGLGMPMDDICLVMGISHMTFLKYYKQDFDTGRVEANAAVAQSIYKQAVDPKNPSATLAIWWEKTRAGRTDTTHVKHSGSIDSGDLTDPERVVRIAALLDAARARRDRDPSRSDSE